MKVCTVIFGLLAACAVSYAYENGPLVTMLQPQPQAQPGDLVLVQPAHPRQKRHLLLGAGLLGAGLLGAGAIGIGALGAGAVVGGAAAGALAGGAFAHGSRSYGYGGGYGGYGGGYGGGYYSSGPSYYVVDEWC